MPKFLVDESTGRKFFALLAKNGFSAKQVADLLPGASDEKIMKFAHSEKMVIITDDKDFGELVFRQNISSFGVVLFRTKSANPEKKLELFIIASEKGVKFEGNFVVITETSVRVRKRSLHFT